MWQIIFIRQRRWLWGRTLIKRDCNDSIAAMNMNEASCFDESVRLLTGAPNSMMPMKSRWTEETRELNPAADANGPEGLPACDFAWRWMTEMHPRHRSLLRS